MRRLRFTERLQLAHAGSTEYKSMRSMEKISWTEHISNEVLRLLEEERSLLTIIRTRQRNWMGHIMTGDSLQREIIEGGMEWIVNEEGEDQEKHYWTG